MDQEAAKQAVALYDANSADTAALARLLKSDWASFGLYVKLLASPKHSNSWREPDVDLVSLNIGNTQHHKEADAIAGFVRETYAKFYRQRIADRNRKLAQLGFKASATP